MLTKSYYILNTILGTGIQGVKNTRTIKTILEKTKVEGLTFLIPCSYYCKG